MQNSVLYRLCVDTLIGGGGAGGSRPYKTILNVRILLISLHNVKEDKYKTLREK